MRFDDMIGEGMGCMIEDIIILNDENKSMAVSK